MEIIVDMILWIFAMYGVLEIIRYFLCIKLHTQIDGIYIVVPVKDQEKNIEAFFRTGILNKYLNDNVNVESIIIADLNSTDDTIKIAKKMAIKDERLQVISINEGIDVLKKFL